MQHERDLLTERIEELVRTRDALDELIDHNRRHLVATADAIPVGR
jgi:hypothetical protein